MAVDLCKHDWGHCCDECQDVWCLRCGKDWWEWCDENVKPLLGQIRKESRNGKSGN